MAKTIEMSEKIFTEILENNEACRGRNTFIETAVYVLDSGKAYPIVGRVRAVKDKPGFVAIPNFYDPSKSMTLPSHSIKSGIVKTFKIGETTRSIVVAYYDGKLTDNWVSPVVMSGYVPDLLKSITIFNNLIKFWTCNKSVLAVNFLYQKHRT